MGEKIFKIKYTYSSRNDIKEKKEYILKTFKYKGLGKRFVDKIKKATSQLKIFPYGYDAIGFKFREYDIHMLSFQSYLVFYVVDEKKLEVTILRILQEGQNWENIIEQWLVDCYT